MYGMVNQAVEQMLVRRFGETMWFQIREKAGVDEEVFISNESYPDELTYNLIGAAQACTGVAAGEILEWLGEFWILETAQRGYGHLMKSSGKTFAEFIHNLPNFHTRIVLMYPQLQPPKFKVVDVDAHTLELHYYSERQGLAPFLLGLLKGLGKMFAVTLEITPTAQRSEVGDHDVFMIRWQASGANPSS
jgi:hypothetical protein